MEIFDASSRVSDDAIEEMMARVRRRFSMKPRVAIAGFGKSGKSSLFNAIYGEAIAKVSMKTDETVDTESHERFGIDFTDTPGIGTGKFSLEKVLQMAVFDNQHVVVHALNGAGAISADDEKLHEAIERSRAKRVTVVNKVDILDEQEMVDYAGSMMEKLGLGPEDFFFVSAKRKTNIERLIRHIADIIPDAMQDAFIAQQTADLGLKEKRIRALIYSKAVIAAAVGLLPVPVADFFIITPIQIAMVTAIGYFHGVEVTRERALELFGVLGAGVGLREVARQLVKFVPVAGPAISSGIAFAGTVALGETANFWFKNKMKVDPEELRGAFRKAAENAKGDYEKRTAATAETSQAIEALQKRHAAGEISDEEFRQAVADLDPKTDGDPN